MARYRDAKCRLCRREGMKLFLKGARCFTDKCAIERRNYPPGQHGLNRGKLTNYGLRLREKQKAKRIYGLLETQFRRYFEWAERQKGVTGENLLKLLELRLDNVVYRLGFAASRREARQMVVHGHIEVDGRKVTVPSYIVRVGETIALRPGSRLAPRVDDNLNAGRGQVPPWLELDAAARRGVVTHSSGNHAQALALAARQRGIPAYIVMPHTAPLIKRQAVADYGGQITLCEPTLAAREETAARIAAATGDRKSVV